MINLATSMMTFDIPVQQILKIVGKTRNTVAKRECDAEFQKYSNIETVYGSVTQSIKVNLEGGGAKMIYVNNPFALIHAACGLNPRFGDFLAFHLQESATLVLYTDEATPGNQLRPDPARSFEALLFTFAELPQWFRDRRHG